MGVQWVHSQGEGDGGSYVLAAQTTFQPDAAKDGGN